MHSGSAQAESTCLTQHVSQIGARSSWLPSQCLLCVPTSNIPHAPSKEESSSKILARVSTGLLPAKPLSWGPQSWPWGWLQAANSVWFSPSFPGNLRRHLTMEAPLWWGSKKFLRRQAGVAAHVAQHAWGSACPPKKRRPWLCWGRGAPGPSGFSYFKIPLTLAGSDKGTKPSPCGNGERACSMCLDPFVSHPRHMSLHIQPAWLPNSFELGRLDPTG